MNDMWKFVKYVRGALKKNSVLLSSSVLFPHFNSLSFYVFLSLRISPWLNHIY